MTTHQIKTPEGHLIHNQCIHRLIKANCRVNIIVELSLPHLNQSGGTDYTEFLSITCYSRRLSLGLQKVAGSDSLFTVATKTINVEPVVAHGLIVDKEAQAFLNRIAAYFITAIGVYDKKALKPYHCDRDSGITHFNKIARKAFAKLLVQYDHPANYYLHLTDSRNTDYYATVSRSRIKLNHV